MLALKRLITREPSYQRLPDYNECWGRTITHQNNSYPSYSMRSPVPSAPPSDNDVNRRVPEFCDYCRKRAPKIRARDKRTNKIDYICHHCKDNDSNLKNIPVKPKDVVKPTRDELRAVFDAVLPTRNCERCHQYVSQIRKIDYDTGTLEFICYQCREEDPVLSRLPVGPKK